MSNLIAGPKIHPQQIGLLVHRQHILLSACRRRPEVPSVNRPCEPTTVPVSGRTGIPTPDALSAKCGYSWLCSPFRRVRSGCCWIRRPLRTVFSLRYYTLTAEFSIPTARSDRCVPSVSPPFVLSDRRQPLAGLRAVDGRKTPRKNPAGSGVHRPTSRSRTP